MQDDASAANMQLSNTRVKACSFAKNTVCEADNLCAIHPLVFHITFQGKGEELFLIISSNVMLISLCPTEKLQNNAFPAESGTLIHRTDKFKQHWTHRKSNINANIVPFTEYSQALHNLIKTIILAALSSTHV